MRTRFAGLMATEEAPVDYSAVSTDATAGAITYTVAQIFGGLILRDPNGASRADLLPTAAAFIAAMHPDGAPIGASIEFYIRNTADAAETITATTNTGLTLSGTMTIAQNNTKQFRAVVTSGSTVTVYSIGTFVH